MRYPRKRDANERAIIDALRAAGASVQQLDGAGVPDLLVGRRALVLMEVKQEHGVPKVGGRRSADGLLDSQRKWWDAWRGPAPVVVTTPAEAIASLERAEGAFPATRAYYTGSDPDKGLPF